MILTDRLVFIHLPKNGGTFTTTVFKALHEGPLSRWVNSRYRWKVLGTHIPWQSVLNTLSQLTGVDLKSPYIEHLSREKIFDTGYSYSLHNTCRHIPALYQNHPILAVIRHPLSRYVSLHEYRWCQKNPVEAEEALRRAYPDYPGLDFSKFLRFINGRYLQQLRSSSSTPEGVGYQTIQYVDFFCREPEYVISELPGTSDPVSLIRDYEYDVRFLHQESLRDELESALRGLGYPEADAASVNDLQRANVSKKSRSHWRDYYGDADMEFACAMESALLERFPEYSQSD